MHPKPRIAWCAPSSETPGATLSQWTSKLLLPILEEHFEIVCFDQHGGDSGVNFAVAEREHSRVPFDLFVYHLENSPAARFARFHLGIRPGVTWFHDLFIEDPGPVSLRESSWRGTIASFVGDRPALPERLEFLSYSDGVDQCAEREAAFSAISIGSTADICVELSRRENTSLRCGRERTRPSFIPTPTRLVECVASRPGKVVFCGGLAAAHRAQKVAQAVRASKCREFVWLVDPQEREAAAGLLSECGVTQGRIETGRAPERWQQIVADAAVALHPGAGPQHHANPWLSISLMAGVPVIAAVPGWGSHIPSRALCAYEPGDHEQLQIAEALKFLLGADSRQIGASGRRFAREALSPRAIAGEFLVLVRHSMPWLRDLDARWSAHRRVAFEALSRESAQILNGSDADERAIFGRAGISWEMLMRPALDEFAGDYR